MNFPSKLVEKAAENLSFYQELEKNSFETCFISLRNEQKYSIGIGKSIIDLVNNIKFVKL